MYIHVNDHTTMNPRYIDLSSTIICLMNELMFQTGVKGMSFARSFLVYYRVTEDTIFI